MDKFSPSDLGFGSVNDADGHADLSLSSLGLDAETRRRGALERSRVRPPADCGRPRDVLAYIDRVFNIVDPPTRTPTAFGHVTDAPPAPTKRTPRPRLPLPERGRPADVLHFIGSFIDADDDIARPRYGADASRDDYGDVLIRRLRRAFFAYSDAPGGNDADVLPDILEWAVERDEHGDGHGDRIRHTRLLHTRRDHNDNLVRATYPTGATTKRGWGAEIKDCVRALRALGYTFDQIDDAVNS